MKRIKGRLSQNVTRLLPAIVFFMILVSAPGCINYYKVTSSKGANALGANPHLLNEATHVIVHFKDSVYALSNASISSNVLTGTVVPVNPVEAKYVRPSTSKKNSYTRMDRNTALNVVQVHTDTVSPPVDS